MTWSHEQITALIELIKQQPCLYNIKHPLYHNKHARIVALENVREELQHVGLNVTWQEIKTKFNNLRTNYLAQHKKYTNCLKSGMSTDDVIKPTLWYYELMTFLLEHSIPRESVDSLSQSIVQSNINSDTGSFSGYSQASNSVEDENDDVPAEPEDEHRRVQIHRIDVINPKKPHVLTKEESAVKTPKKRKISIEEDPLIKSATLALNDISNALAFKPTLKESNNSVFAQFIANNLDIIEQDDEEIYIEVQQQITTAIWNARRTILQKRNAL